MNVNHFLTLVTILLLVAGQVLWKIGLSGISSIQSIEFYFRAARNIYVITGLILYALSTLLWFRIISIEPLGKIYPIMALSYPVAMIFGAIIFGDKITVFNWLGVCLIICGIVLVIR